MAKLRTETQLAGVVGLLVCLACGDSADGGDETKTNTDTTATSSSGPTTTMTAPTASTAMPTSSTAADTGTTSTDSSSSGGGEEVTLQNDAWTPGDGLVWQTWPSMGDCWGSSYEVDAGLLPLELVAVEVAIGGDTATQTYEVSVWEMDGGLPSQAIDAAMVDIEGDAASVPLISLEDELDLPLMESGAFAVVMCHVDHMGAPSIGIDMDGNVDGSHNFVFQVLMDEWVNSPDFFGIEGDFIMRTIARTAG